MINVPARKSLINNEWKFIHGDFPNAKDWEFNDGDWYDIGLPHSFGIPYFMDKSFYVGYGCYRKILNIQKGWIGKQLSLEFQAVFQNAEIYLNGVLAGKHQGGYTAFQMDITSLAREGDNLLFVRVDNLWNPCLPPRAGEHVFNGGIYRDVSLIITDDVHIDWYGTYVKTPDVSKTSAKLEIETDIVNQSLNAVECLLVSVIEYKGTAVAEIRTTQFLQSAQCAGYHQSAVIDNPKLWYPDTPNLYTLKSYLYVKDRLTDTYETTFGIRWFKFDAEKGFFLNGEHYDIWGTNVHQDHAGWSDAVTHAGIARDIKLIKDCGMNFIRGSHYPHHSVFAEECDKQGILFWSELCFWGTGGPNVDGYWTSSAYPVHENEEQEFEQNCKTALREMIRVNRNHPSIIAWSMCNEVFFSDDNVMQKARDLVSALVRETHKLDDKRPAAVGGVQRNEFDVLGDLAGYNGDGASLYTDPGFPNLVTEYGSKVSYRPGAFEPNYSDGVEKNPVWRSGKALWCGFHHGSLFDDMGRMGMIDYFRLPLNTWYWYRKTILGIEPPEPLKEGIPYELRLSSDKAEILTDGTDDAHIIVTVHDKNGKPISNTVSVKLEIISGDGVFPTGKSIVLSKDKSSFFNGSGAIEFRSYYGGENIISAKGDGLIAADLHIKAVGHKKEEGRKLKLPLPPPYTETPDFNSKSYNVSKYHPVFCSSFDILHPAKDAIDESKETFWRAEKSEPGEWIMVDLEGPRKVYEIKYEFVDSVSPHEVSISVDGNNFTKFETGNGDARVFTLNLNGRFIRYFKIAFTSVPSDIRNISIFNN